MGGMVLGIREKIERGKGREVERGEGVVEKDIFGWGMVKSSWGICEQGFG